MAVANFLGTFDSWLPLDNFDNAEWIHQQWVEMFLKKCASEICEAWKKGRRGNKPPVTDFGEHASEEAGSNLPELPNTIFMVVMCWVSNGNDIVLSRKQLQAPYPDVRNWEELIDFINKNGCPTESYILTSMFKCTWEQARLDKEYMGLYTKKRMITDTIYGQISYNCCLLNGFKLKLGNNPKIFLVEMMRVIGKEIVEHILRPAKVIPAGRVKGRCAQLLIIIQGHWKVLKRVEQRRERRMVGKRMILELM